MLWITWICLNLNEFPQVFLLTAEVWRCIAVLTQVIIARVQKYFHSKCFIVSLRKKSNTTLLSCRKLPRQHYNKTNVWQNNISVDTKTKIFILYQNVFVKELLLCQRSNSVYILYLSFHYCIIVCIYFFSLNI